MKKLKILLIAMAVPLSLWAATTKITYQGQLRESGVPVNQNKTMNFKIFTSSSGGSAVWSSGNKTVSVTGGLFRTTLDPTGVNWESPAYLEIDVDGTTLSPREELTASAFSNNAQQLQGKNYTSAASAPGSPSKGDLWFDTGANTFNVWNGSGWDILNAGAGGTITIENGDATVVGSASNVDFDLNTFSVTSGPSGEANVAVQSSSVTLQGNTFNAADQLVKLDGAGSLTISGWSSIKAVLTSTKSMDFGATAGGACGADTIGIPGAADGDVVTLGIPNALATSDPSQVIYGFVSSSNVVTVRRCNPCNATGIGVSCSALADPAAATVRVDVWKH